jgi:hypothetical protein
MNAWVCLPTADIFPVNVLLPGGTLAILLAAMYITALLVRRHFKKHRREGRLCGPAFSLEQLRQMHRNGKITDEEYKILSEKVLHETLGGISDKAR